MTDIDLASACGVDGVVIAFPAGSPRLKYEFPRWTEAHAIDVALKAVSHAKNKDLKTTFFLMDSSRSDRNFLERLLTRPFQRDASRCITVVDTSGCFLPKAAASQVTFVKQITGRPVEIHTHNDMGLGLATTLAAIEAGAEIAHVCVNGLGERGGNVSLDELLVALRFLYGQDNKIDYRRLTELAKMVETLSNIPLTEINR